MTPKMGSVLQKFSMLKHNLENDMEQLGQRVDDADVRRGTVTSKANATLDAAHAGMGEIEEFLTAMDGANGAPGNSSAASAPRSSDIAKK